MAIVESRGARIYYEVHGAGEPLVLVMGLGVDGHGWELQVPAFAARHQVIVIDNRGVGRSDKPAGRYSTAEMAGDVAAVLDAVGIARAHVLGLSMGGMIAQELALASPERVGALVLACTYARPGSDITEIGDRGSQELTSARTTLLGLVGGKSDVDPSTLNPLDVMRFLMPMVFSPQFLATRADWLRQFFMRSMGYGFSINAFVGQVGACIAHDTTPRLPSLRAPTLVVTGDRDRLVPMHHSEELASLIPGARLAVLGGGTHGFNFEIPDEFNRTVLDFLAAHPLSGGQS